MIRCIIIEDQPPAQRVLQKFIGDMESLELKATFADALKAMDFLKSESIDLIFLDIHLPKISGIDFLKTIPNVPNVILTTAFSDYALESYDLNVVDYLLKPFSFERFIKAVNKVPVGLDASKKPSEESNRNSKSRPDVLFIKSGYEHLKIQVSEILYIQSEADYTEIFTSEKKFLTSHSLRHWLQTLGDVLFVQIHKSFIVNTTNITKVSGNRIYFDTDTHVPIGRAYKEEFVERYLK
ncbi:two component transcriptional regulator, LytTR family [Pricia antarctica]|uniref:Two component transcriptional regulator, LytTR family n=1 Tax=Pricia antarctica TaxID=641691 RepID=A0A1G7AP33_9FLAO|nr:LytTR family DNA-binding domain-containing protein [Pricia antarctica]SDE16629.1 two component transcriptional regulator, LytTR family [Pricia antarctica]